MVIDLQITLFRANEYFNIYMLLCVSGDPKVTDVLQDVRFDFFKLLRLIINYEVQVTTF